MSSPRRPAREVAHVAFEGALFIDHAVIIESDADWMADVEKLVLWNVVVPTDFLAQLRKLWWLDIRGGSASDLTAAEGCTRLRYLRVNQVRGFADLSSLKAFTSLVRLDLYGLPKVEQIPSLRSHKGLRMADIGQMRGLSSLRGLLEAPHLRELWLVRKVAISDADIEAICAHPSLERFDWYGEDVPVRVWRPVVERVGLPPIKVQHPGEWFNALEQAQNDDQP